MPNKRDRDREREKKILTLFPELIVSVLIFFLELKKTRSEVGSVGGGKKVLKVVSATW